MSRFQPRKATRTQLKARVALDGPTGSGKTYTSIEWAMILQGAGRTVVIDTERGSASWYCDRWDYDVVDWSPPYDPNELAKAIGEAAAAYDVVIIDSLSHFWEGEGGTLDIADAAGQRSGGNSFAGWKVATPALRHLVDEIVGCDAHVIATMRSKMEYVLEDDSRGKKVPRKIGMAPVMRQGIEYEFTLIADMDLEHRLVVAKSRCSALADQVYPAGRTDEAATAFLAWLNMGDAPPAGMSASQSSELSAKLAALSDEASRMLKDWWRDQRLPKLDRLNHDQADAVLAKLGGGGEVEEPVPPPVAAPTAPPPPPPPPPVLSAVASDDDKLSAAQSKALHSGMRKAGILPDDRHAWLTAMLDREIASASDVTRSEASRLIDRLLDGNPDEVASS